MAFPKNSAFHQADTIEQASLSRKDIDEAINKALNPTEKPAAKIASGPPLDHWNHDLETVDILLGQDPPDTHRARQLVEDVRREIYREMR